jgi:hypothetical protein
MMEMLVSSRPGTLELLPALPEALDRGALWGVKGRNRVTVQGLRWDLGAGRVSCTLRSDIDQSITLIERHGINTVRTQVRVGASSLGPIARRIDLRRGVSTPILITLGQLPVGPPAPPASHGRLLSQGRPVIASSVRTQDGDMAAANVVDGDEASRWSSDYQDDQWIQVDLGSPRPIMGVRLDWEQAAGRDYAIEVSSDGRTWQTVVSVTDNSHSGWLDYPALKARGRYVRIDCKTQATTCGFSLREFQVFGR